MDLPNERIIELEERMAEITQSEQQKTEKKKLFRVLGSCGTITKHLTFVLFKFHREKQKSAGLNKHLNK